MTSSNGNIFLVTGPLCGEFTGHRWIPLTKASDAELYVFFDLCLNKRLRKQSWGWWLETPSRSLWRHCNGMKTFSILLALCEGNHRWPVYSLHKGPNMRSFDVFSVINLNKMLNNPYSYGGLKQHFYNRYPFGNNEYYHAPIKITFVENWTKYTLWFIHLFPVIKLVLWIVCWRVKQSSAQALAQDHRNDVLSNSIALACGLIGNMPQSL